MISERAIHDMVMEAIVAAQNGKPMPDFGYLADEARNQYAARRWRTKR